MPLTTRQGSAINFLSAQHLAEQEGSFEPQRGNNGLIVVFGVSNWLFGANDAITFAVESFETPTLSIGQIELHWQGQNRKVCGNCTYETLTVVVKDMVDKNIYGSLLDWQYGVFNSGYSDRAIPEAWITGGPSVLPRHARGLARNYKKTGLIFLFSPSGLGPSATLTKVFLLEGLYPVRVSSDGIDMSSDDKLEVMAELSLDSAMLVWPYVPIEGLGAAVEGVGRVLTAGLGGERVDTDIAELAASILGIVAAGGVSIGAGALL